MGELVRTVSYSYYGREQTVHKRDITINHEN